MIRKRWVQVRSFLSCTGFLEPIAADSLIMVPRNKLIGLMWRFVDDRCYVPKKDLWRH